MLKDYSQTNFGAAKKFRLIIREGGVTREMGGEDQSIAVGITDMIFMNALETGTSDIHLQPERDQLRVRFRQDGVLHNVHELPPDQAQDLLERMEPEDAEDIRRLLSYDELSAGGMMTTEPSSLANSARSYMSSMVPAVTLR